MIRPLFVAAMLATAAVPAAAQRPAGGTAATTAALATDLLQDLAEVEKKMVGLAQAIPADKYDWRPAQGVRSVGEVLMHVAGDNYLIPAAAGFTADAATGIKGDDYKTAVAFEQRKLAKDATITELQKSFAHLRKSLTATSNARLAEKVSMFGQSYTMQQTWVLAATHVHEHLGQLIAYARSNGIAPPWS